MARSRDPKFGGTTSGLLLHLDLGGVVRGRASETLADNLRNAVRNRTMPRGTRLPASRTLARDLAVSRGVVVRAYEQLIAEGYLASRHGSGTVVADVRDLTDVAPPRPQPRASNPGLPSGGAFPRAAWARCSARAFADLVDVDFGYGDPAGFPRLRHELSKYLGRVRAVLAPPERIIIVNGFAQVSRLVADVLTDGGICRIGIEDPGSVGLREQLARSGVTCVPVAVDRDGLQVDALETAGVNAVVVTPAHQFPTGAVMSPERRHALLAWARRNEAVIVEDDYDAEFRFDRMPVGALQGLGPDVVLYGGSVSKTLSPGVRLGWLVVPEHLVATYTEAKYTADLARGVLDQATLAEFLACGEMDRHIRRMTGEYRRRRDTLARSVQELLPDWHVTGTAAGLHLVLRPPSGDEATLVDLARHSGLDARPLGLYCVDVNDGPGLVVGYGHQTPAALATAVHALREEIPRMRPEGAKRRGTLSPRAR